MSEGTAGDGKAGDGGIGESELSIGGIMPAGGDVGGATTTCRGSYASLANGGGEGGSSRVIDGGEAGPSVGTKSAPMAPAGGDGAGMVADGSWGGVLLEAFVATLEVSAGELVASTPTLPSLSLPPRMLLPLMLSSMLVLLLPPPPLLLPPPPPRVSVPEKGNAGGSVEGTEEGAGGGDEGADAGGDGGYRGAMLVGSEGYGTEGLGWLDGPNGDGARGDGARGDGAWGDGARGDGARGDGGGGRGGRGDGGESSTSVTTGTGGEGCWGGSGKAKGW